MSRRTKRLSSLIRSVVGELLVGRLSDPRIDPVRTSITQVEVPEDLLTAKVYVSVMGTEAQQRNTIRALCSAAGRIQEMMIERIKLRHTPVLEFMLDTKYKKTLETLQRIQSAMDEIHQKEEEKNRIATSQQVGEIDLTDTVNGDSE